MTAAPSSTQAYPAERAANPFLRPHDPAIRAALGVARADRLPGLGLGAAASRSSRARKPTAGCGCIKGTSATRQPRVWAKAGATGVIRSA